MSDEPTQLIVSPRVGQVAAVGGLIVAMLSLAVCIHLLGQTRYAADIGLQASFTAGQVRGEARELSRQIDALRTELEAARVRLAALERDQSAPEPEPEP